MSAKVGQFQVTTAIATTVIPVTGVGFRPTGVFFRWSGRNSNVDSGPSRETVRGGYGYILANGERGCISYFLQDNADPYQAGSGLWNDEAIVRQSTNAATSGRADFSSMDSDGFSIVIDEQFGAEITVIYEAYADVEFDAIEITEPGATGVQTYSGVPFRPTIVKVLGTGKAAYDTPAADADFCIGAATAAAAAQNGVLARFEANNLGVGDTSEYCRQTECLAICNATNVLVRASLSAFTADGVSLDWLERNGARRFLLVVASGKWFVGNDLTEMNVNPFSSTGIGFISEGVEVFSNAASEPAQDTVNTADPQTSVGFGTGPAERHLIHTRGNPDGNSTASQIAILHEFDEIYANIDIVGGVPQVDGLMDINSAFTQDEIEWVMDIADDAQKFFWYLAFGGGAFIPGPRWWL